MPPNGPAIKCVCVAEQVKAGPVFPLLSSVLSPAEKKRSMARFLASWYRLSDVYVFRGTIVIGDLF
jgi:hypothetical protein